MVITQGIMVNILDNKVSNQGSMANFQGIMVKTQDKTLTILINMIKMAIKLVEITSLTPTRTQINSIQTWEASMAKILLRINIMEVRISDFP
jgi:hypothetical protein